MTEARARALLSRFPTLNVLVVGDVMLDRYVRGRVDRISPEAPVPILRAEKSEDMPGGAGNTASNLASLGARTFIASAVGRDAAGSRLREALQNETIKPLLVEDAHRPTTEKIRYLQKGHQLLRVDSEHTTPLAEDVEQALLAHLQRALHAVHAVVVSDYAKGVMTPRVAAALLEAKAENALFVAVDAKPANAKLFTGCSFLSPNLREAREFLRKDPVLDDTPVLRLGQELAAAFEAHVYLTLGADGMFVCCPGIEEGIVPQVHAREVADVSGAGDTAVAALTLALLSGATPMEAAEFANAACAVVVAKVGAASALPEEIAEAVRHRVPIART